MDSGASQSFTLTVNAAPGITSSSAVTFTKGQSGSITITTTGFPTAALSEIGTLPAGLTFSDNGDGTATLGGTPAASGSFAVTITATNGVGSDATQTFTVNVNEAPAITSATSTTFTARQANSFNITTTGFPAAAFSVVGLLPPGITLTDHGDGTATLGGTLPLLTGTYTVHLSASNGIGSDATQVFTINVIAPPQFTSSPNATFTTEITGTFKIQTSPGLPSTTSLQETGALPTGVTFH